MSAQDPRRFQTTVAALLPGVLVAATGVGAGDLLTASLGGSKVGLGILWAAWIGAILKWFLNEGLARWQMGTGTTLLEGWIDRLGAWIQWVFFAYLLAWSFFTAGAILTACGVAASSMLPIGDDPLVSKRIWGCLHSAIGVVLVLAGGFAVFEWLMAACIGVMFVSVVFTALMSGPDWSAVATGLVVPAIPAGGLQWVLGVLGGVGGTVTLLSYGYWIREKRRTGLIGVRQCRTDLAVGYGMTAMFGICMIIIGSRVDIERGSDIAIQLASQLEQVIGPAGRWVFLIGFWGAVFSSLLGVWQSVPYLFADFLLCRRRVDAQQRQSIDLDRTFAYRVYLVALAVVPLPVLWTSLIKAQMIYAVVGSLFMPLLALTLLILNNRKAWIGARYRNGWITNCVLVATLVFFVYAGIDASVRRINAMRKPAATAVVNMISCQWN